MAATLLVGFAINANHLTYQNGVAGLVLYNCLALVTGTMMLWHLARAIRCIRQGRVRDHIHQVCAVLSWTCFPGMIRLFALLPQQLFLHTGEGENECDAMNTSGMMLNTFPITVLGLAALQWAASGAKYQHRNYVNFYVLMTADFLIGLFGNTLFQCHPDGALLEQLPGKPWVLRGWQDSRT